MDASIECQRNQDRFERPGHGRDGDYGSDAPRGLVKSVLNHKPIGPRCGSKFGTKPNPRRIASLKQKLAGSGDRDDDIYMEQKRALIPAHCSADGRIENNDVLSRWSRQAGCNRISTGPRTRPRPWMKNVELRVDAKSRGTDCVRYVFGSLDALSLVGRGGGQTFSPHFASLISPTVLLTEHTLIHS